MSTRVSGAIEPSFIKSSSCVPPAMNCAAAAVGGTEALPAPAREASGTASARR